MSRMSRDERVKRLKDRVLALSQERPREEAYELAEKLEKKNNGSRVYKNYNSYRANISKRDNK